MSTYTRQLAKRIREQNEIRDIYKERAKEAQTSYDTAVNTLKSGGDVYSLDDSARAMYRNIQSELARQSKEEQERLKKEREQMSGIERFGHTLGDFFGRMGAGAFKAGEGIVDYFGTMFGADEDWIKRDFSREYILDHLDNNLKGSYLNDGKFGNMVQNVAFGFGNMLPSVLVGTLPYVGPALSTATFMLNAAGGSTENALQNGATRNNALLYGTLSGISEGAIEKISGGIGGVGKGIVQSVGKSAGKSAVAKGVLGTAKKYTGRMIGEGLEEVASDVIDPLLRATYTGNVDYSDMTAGSLAETFGVGAMTSGLMLGGQAMAHNATAANRVRTKLGELNEVKATLDKRYYDGKLTEAQYKQGLSDINWLAEKTIKTMNRVSDRKAEKIVDKVGEKRLENAGIIQNAGKFSVNQANVTYNYKAMTPSLANKVDSLAYQPTSAELTAEQESLVKDYGKINNGKASIVFTDDIGAVTEDGSKLSANGAYSDGVIYISRTAENPLREVMKHEFTHALEGSKAYGKFADFVIGEIQKSPVLQKEYGDFAKTFIETAEQYQGVTADERAIVSEIVAKYSERLFSDPKAINRLARANKGLAMKVLGMVTDRLSALGKGKGTAEMRKFLRRAEGLYRKAITAKPSRVIALNGNTANEKDTTANINENSNTTDTTNNIENTANIANSTENRSNIETNSRNIDENSNISDGKESISKQFDLKESIKNLNSYSELERNRILANRNNLIAEDYQSIIDFITESKNDLKNKFLYIGKINSDIVLKIKDETGINVNDYSYVLNSEDIRHIFKNHSDNNKESERGQLAVTNSNVLDIIDTMLMPDGIRKEYNEKSGVVSIVFEKVINERLMAITVLSNDKKRLTLKSARIMKKRRIVSPPVQSTSGDKTSTSKTLRSLNSSNNSISNSETNVNNSVTESLKNQENNTNIDENSNIADGKPKIQYAIKNVDKIKINFEENENAVKGMKPVTSIKSNVFQKGNTKLTDMVAQYFNSLGNNVFNAELGDIELNKMGIKDSMAHGIGALKAAAFKAVPRVIEKGKILDYQENWKSRGKDTVVLSAPILIDGIQHYMGVILLRELNSGMQRFYLHEISLNKKEVNPFKTATAVGQANSKRSGLTSNNIISNSETNVNNSAIESLKNQDSKANIDENSNKDIKFSLKNANNTDSKGTHLTAEQAELFKKSEVRDSDDKLLVVYHGTPYGTFHKFKGEKVYFFSISKEFAEEYADTKAFDNGLDSQTTIVEAYLNSTKLFDINNKRDFDFLKTHLPDEIEYGFGGRIFNKNEFLELLKGNQTVMPIWSKEQIKDATFGEQIGKGSRDGQSDAVFVGIDSNNDVVFVDRYAGKYLKYISEAEINKLLSGKPVKANYYKNAVYDNEISVAEFNALKANDTRDLFYYMPKYEMIMPQKTTQEITHKKGQDNWTYVELSLFKYNGKTESLIDLLKRAGYDGIKVTEKGVDNYAVYNSNQIKLTTNKIPTSSSDIRFSLKANKAQLSEEITLTAGQIESVDKALKAIENDDIARSHIANAIKSLRIDIDGKTYRVVYNDKYYDVSIDMLTKALEGIKNNSLADINMLAKHIINAIELYDENAYKLLKGHSKTELNKISKLLSHAKRNKIRLSGSLITANDTQIVNEYCSVDGAVTLTSLVNQLKEMGITIKGRTLINKLQNIDKLYDTVSNSKNGLKLADIAPKKVGTQQRVIANRIIKSIDKTCAMTAIIDSVKNVEKAKAKADEEKAKADAKMAKAKEIEKQSYEREKMEAPIIQIKDICARFKEYAERNYRTGSILAMPDMDGIIKAFNKITWVRGLRSNKSIHEALTLLQSFIKANRNAEYVVLGFSSEIVDKIDELVEVTRLKPYDSKPDKIQTKREVDMLLKVVKAVDYLFKHHHAIVLNGEVIDVAESTETAIKELDYACNFNKGINAISMKESSITSDPRTIYTMVSGAFDDNNVIMRLYDDLLKSETEAKLTAIELLEPVEQFFKDNKQYKKDIYNKKITVHGASLELGQAIMIYMQSKQVGVIDRLTITGAYGTDSHGKAIDIKSINASDIEAIEKQLSKADFELIKLFEDTFSRSGQVKYEADNNLNGYSDITPGKYYVPLVVEDANLAKSYTSASQWAEEFNERNHGFNQHRNRMATKQLKLVNIFDEVYRYCHELGVYANLTQAFRNFDQLMNYNINLGNPNSREVITLKSYIKKNVWSGFDKYQLEFFADIRGDKRQSQSAIIQWLRNNWIVAKLGLNIKSWVSQFSGLAMGVIHLDFKHLAKGVATPMKKERFLEYGGYAKVRVHERAAMRAKGFEGKLGRINSWTTKPIQMADNLMMRQFMSGCESQIEEQLGHKVTTREEMDLVCDLFETTVRETQSGDMISEKSALQRHSSDVLRTLATFKSDAIKMISNIKKNIYKIIAAKKFLKANPNSERGKLALKEAKKRLRRSVTGMTVSNAIYVGIALLFSLLLRKRDEEGKKWGAEDYGKAFGMGMLESFVGMYPLIGDIFNKATSGYDIEQFSYSMINDLVDGTVGVFKLIENSIKGEEITKTDGMKALRNVFYAVSEFFGVPSKNMFKYSKMIVGWFDEGALYKHNSLFYPAKRSELNAAIEEKNDRLAESIFGVMMTERGYGDMSETAQKKLLELYKAVYKDGDSVIPSNVPNKVTWKDGNGAEQEKELKAADKVVYRENNAKAAKDIEKLLKSGEFSSLSKKEQADAVKKIYAYYNALSKAKVTEKEEINTQMLLASLLSVEDMAILSVKNASLVADKYANGKIIPESKKKKLLKLLNTFGLTFAEKELVRVILGYSPSNPKTIKQTIHHSSLSSEEKAYLIAKID